MQIKDYCTKESLKILAKLENKGLNIELGYNNTIGENICGLLLKDITTNTYRVTSGSSTPKMSYIFHEILHIYLLENGFKLQRDIFHKIGFQDINLMNYYSMFDNELAHYKMLPILVKSNFPKEEFKWIQYDNSAENFLSTCTDIQCRIPLVAFILLSRIFDKKIIPNTEIPYDFLLKHVDLTVINEIERLIEDWDKSASYDTTDFYRGLTNI